MRREWIFRLRLRRVWRDDFEIFSFAEREKSVLGAAPGVHAAECCAHAGAAFHEVDAGLQILGAKKNVIEQGGNLVLSEESGWSEKSAAGEGEKVPAGDECGQEKLQKRFIHQ